MSMNYGRFLNAQSLLRKPSPIRALAPLLSIPGMISLGGGNPNTLTFPFKKINCQLQDGSSIDLDEQETKMALQYSPTNGFPCLLKLLTKLQENCHKVDPKSFDICITHGSQDALSKSFDMFLEPGDSVLLSSPTYSGTLAILQSKRCELIGKAFSNMAKCVEIGMDSEGVIPELLRKRLEDLPSHISKPNIFYIVPNGSNPSGTSTSQERRKEIYKIACEFDLLILEDDPYYLLEFADRMPSFLSLDNQGRVLRFDSFSKVLAAGMRLGFVTGPQPLIERISLHEQSSNLHACGISQVLVLKYIESIGIQGLLTHSRHVAQFYKKQRDKCVRMIDKHLGEYVDYDIPRCGMFLWLGIKCVKDTFSFVKNEMVNQKVLFVPGSDFLANPSPSNRIRVSYSTATEKEMDMAFRRLKVAIENYKKY